MRSRQQTCSPRVAKQAARCVCNTDLAEKTRKPSDVTQVSFFNALDEVHPARTSTESSHLKRVFTVVQPQEPVCWSYIPSAEQLMFMRAVGQATISFDPHFASSQISLRCPPVRAFIRWLQRSYVHKNLVAAFVSTRWPLWLLQTSTHAFSWPDLLFIALSYPNDPSKVRMLFCFPWSHNCWQTLLTVYDAADGSKEPASGAIKLEAHLWRYDCRCFICLHSNSYRSTGSLLPGTLTFALTFTKKLYI